MSRGGCSSRTTVALFVVGLLVKLGIQLDSVWFWFGLLCIHRVGFSVVFCRDRFLAFPVKFSAAFLSLTECCVEKHRLQLRCSPTATSFFHSQKVVLRNTGLLSSAAHAQSSLSNQNDCSRCAATEDCAAVLACAAQPKSGGESVPSRS